MEEMVELHEPGASPANSRTLIPVNGGGPGILNARIRYIARSAVDQVVAKQDVNSKRQIADINR